MNAVANTQQPFICGENQNNINLTQDNDLYSQSNDESKKETNNENYFNIISNLLETFPKISTIFNKTKNKESEL